MPLLNNSTWATREVSYSFLCSLCWMAFEAFKLSCVCYKTRQAGAIKSYSNGIFPEIARYQTFIKRPERKNLERPTDAYNEHKTGRNCA